MANHEWPQAVLQSMGNLMQDIYELGKASAMNSNDMLKTADVNLTTLELERVGVRLDRANARIEESAVRITAYKGQLGELKKQLADAHTVIRTLTNMHHAAPVTTDLRPPRGLHFIEKCQHGFIGAQCRCFSNNRVEHRIACNLIVDHETKLADGESD